MPATGGLVYVAHTFQEQVDQGHGRRERRRCWVITGPEELAYVDS